MTGWNMPPGCNPSDIPGNGPNDEAEEVLLEEIGTILDSLAPNRAASTEDDGVDPLTKWIVERFKAAWQDGYATGQSDERMATELTDDLMRAQMPHFQLIVGTDKWPTLADRRRNVARLLRSTADRIDSGEEYGGFHFNPGDSNEGGFAFQDKDVDIPETSEARCLNADFRNERTHTCHDGTEYPVNASGYCDRCGVNVDGT